MKTIIDNLSKTNEYKFYLAFFRIFICIHLMKKVILSWSFKGIIYAGDSFFLSENSDFFNFFGISQIFIRDNFSIFYFIYIICIVLHFFGIGKKIVAFALFFCFEILQNLCPAILNGGDNLLKFIMLYMIFANSYNYFCVNCKNHYEKKNILFDTFLSNLSVYAICFHVCFAYFISAIHKIHADLWFNGIATYYTLSLERFRGTNLNLILAKNAFFVTISTYYTMVIELFYPVLIWFDKTKFKIIILAILLHISIYVFMMIYDFQLVFIFAQGFFIKDKEFKSLKAKLIKTNKLIIYYDGWCPICINFKKFVTKFDFLRLIDLKDIRKSSIISDEKIQYMYSKNNKKEFYGFDSIFEVQKRLPLLWLFIPITLFLKVTKVGQYVYREFSIKRKIIAFHCDENCLIK